jgi:hypothetical protein
MVANPLADPEEEVDDPQRKMMMKASRYHLLRGQVVGVITVLVAVAGMWLQAAIQTASIQTALRNAHFQTLLLSKPRNLGFEEGEVGKVPLDLK